MSDRVWTSLLVDGFYLTSLAVSAIFFAATQRLTGARWSVGLRRIPEAWALTLPVGAAMLLGAAVFGREALYPWARPGAFSGEPDFAGKIVYLRPAFVLARMAIVLAIWMGFAIWFRRASRDERRLDRLAAAFVPVFALTFTVASYDFLISLEPGWFSTMFAVYVFAGSFVQGIAAITLATVILRRRGLLGDVGAGALHDLGKLLLAFTTFWAYTWVCQYLLIWYGDLPEEVGYYVVRTSGPWLPLFLGGLALGWLVPFLVLLPVAAKRSPRVLAAVSALILVARWLDVYLLVAPSQSRAPELGLVDLGIAAVAAALVVLVFARRLAVAPRRAP